MAEILSKPSADWKAVLDCSKCGTTARYTEDDLQYDTFKMSGYDFNDTADWQGHYFVQCPTCTYCLLIDRSQVTEVMRLYLISHGNYHKATPR